MKKIVLFSLLSALGLVAIFFTVGGEVEKRVATLEPEVKVGNKKIDEPTKKVDEVAKKEPKAQKPQESVAKKESEEAPQKLVISENNMEEEMKRLHQEYSFEPLSVSELSQELPPRKLVKPVTALAMSKDEFKNLHVGNKISFVDIEGMNYSVELKSVDPMNGSSSFFGKIKSADGMSYRTIVTVGDDGSGYIHLATSKGVYEIELKDGKGYVYRSSDIQRGMGDQKEDDFIVMKQSEE